MPVIQTILRFLDARADIPKYLGLFHLIWLAVFVAATITLCILWKKGIIKNVKKVVLVTSLVLVILGLYKQIVLSFEYDPNVSFSYDWNNFPWHFITTAVCVGLFVGLTDGNVNKNFTAYLSTYGLLAGLWGMFKPSVFEEANGVIGLNVYTMLCSGALIMLAVFLFVTEQVKIEIKTFLKSIPVFLMLVGIAITFNEALHLVFPQQNTSMFSISRHFASDTPIYSSLHNALLQSGGKFTVFEYLVSILAYILLVSAFALLPLLAMMCAKKLATTDFDAEYGDTLNSKRAMSANERKELLDKIDTLEKQVANKSNNPFLIHYFENLRVNFGNNTKGSCGYVALAMILSYYDTVLNDRIIPENYDQPSKDYYTSPGIRKEYPDEDINRWTYERYKQYIDEKKNLYLHAKLMDLVDENGLVLDKYTEEYNFGSNDIFREAILYDYLKKVAKIPSKNCEVLYPTILINNKYETFTDVLFKNLNEINKENRRVYDARTGTKRYIMDDYYSKCLNNILYCSNSIKKYAVNMIKNHGVPVLLSLQSLQDVTEKGITRLGCVDGHAVVAYAVTDDDELICHFGWPTRLYSSTETFDEMENKYTSVLPTSEYKNLIYDSAVVINFKNMPHVHTNNYEIKLGEKTYYYCPDGTFTTKDGDLVQVIGNWITSIREGGECALEGYKGNILPKNYVLKIPESFNKRKTTIIGPEALKNQIYLQEIIIPDGIYFIWANAFENCSSLNTITIPKSVAYIGKETFKNCRSLCYIQYNGTVNEWNKIQKDKNWNEKTGNYTVYCSDGAVKKNDNSYGLIFK